MSTSMGWALKHAGTGPAVITLRHKSPVVKGIETASGANVVSLDELIELRAVQWREVIPDGWELHVEQMHPQSGNLIRTLWYVSGSDILTVQVQSKLSS